MAFFQLSVCSTVQTIYNGNSQSMTALQDNSINLIVTSPPYFDAKNYSQEPGDLGNIHDLDKWFEEIGKVWAESYRVLQPGRKMFINIMNLSVQHQQSFRTLNMVGKTIDLCESIGFVYKRDIVWQKTNSVQARIGSYPYPGGILLNYTHEFILEFEKPAPKHYKKYAHLTPEQKEASRLSKDFWISIKKSDVWVIAPEKSGKNRQHIAPFPLELPKRFILAYSYVGETILDPFAGSGTTLKAAAILGRHGVGYELAPKYCSLIRTELEQLRCQGDLQKNRY